MMLRLARAGLTTPAVAGRGLSELLGLSLRRRELEEHIWALLLIALPVG